MEALGGREIALPRRFVGGLPHALLAAGAGALLALAIEGSGAGSAPSGLAMALVLGACATSFVLGRRSVQEGAELWIGVPPLDSQLRLELDRCRRHGHAVSVVRPPQGLADPTVLGRLLRSTDRLVVEAGVPFVVMPETTAGQARAWLARACGPLGDLATARVVAFPEDELTAAGMLDVLRTRPVVARG